MWNTHLLSSAPSSIIFFSITYLSLEILTIFLGILRLLQTADLLPVKSVGVQGDERTYREVCTLRAVTSEDAMTADWYRMPYDVLQRASGRICNEVKGVNRVLYDISSKPPATIEWE